MVTSDTPPVPGTSLARTGLWIAGSLGALGAVAVLGDLRFGSPLYFFRDVVGSMRPGEGAMTAISGLLIAVSGVLHVLVGRFEQRSSSPAWWWWSVAGLGLVYLGLDEILAIHEWLTLRLDELRIPRLLGMDRDVYVFGGYAVGAGLVGSRLYTSWRRRPALWPALIATVGLATASQILDALPWSGMAESDRRVLGPLEEILKTTATLCATLYSVTLVECTVEDLRPQSSATPSPANAAP